jgi:HTH-type transcriptional regulator / antitoxin HigA
MPGSDDTKMAIGEAGKTSETYLQLVREFPLRRLKTVVDHRQALSVYRKLALRPARRKPDVGSAEYLDVLVDLIVDYERRSGRTIDTRHLTPAQIVRHFLAERGMSVTALAKAIGVGQSNLSEMLSGRRSWSKTAIAGLVEIFNIDPRRFLRPAKAA